MSPPDDTISVGRGEKVGAADGLKLSVGAGDMVGANDHGDEAQSGLSSLLSKHSHWGGDREKSHSPRPAQFAGHIDLRIALIMGQKTWT